MITAEYIDGGKEEPLKTQWKTVLRYTTSTFLVCLGAMVACALAVPKTLIAAVGDKDAGNKCEITGTLEVGVIAIGGETTGTVIHAKQATWELDFKGDKKLEDLAETLNRKTVLVTGTCRKIKGVEIPERQIIEVTSLKPVEKK